MIGVLPVVAFEVTPKGSDWQGMRIIVHPSLVTGVVHNPTGSVEIMLSSGQSWRVMESVAEVLAKLRWEIER